MKNFIRDNKILWLVKIAAAAFQIPATWHVFTKLFEEAGRGQIETYITSFFAIVLIDALIIIVMYFLESGELNPLDKSAWAFGGVALLVSIFYIGYKDEGAMSFAPRIGVLLLISIDLFSWSTEFTTYYFSREQIEKRLRNKQVLHRNKQDKKAWREARKKLYPELVQLQMKREIQLLGLDELYQPTESTPLPEPVEQSDLMGYAEYVEPNIVQLPSGGYGWSDPVTGEITTTTALGKPYSLQGARSALSRSRNGA